MIEQQLLTRDKWLVSNGFEQDGQAQNPFTRSAHLAEYDPRRVECFEEFPYYEDVKGTLQSPGPALIYAVRGGGKSALRCQILSDLDHTLNSDSGHILAVVYDQFDRLLAPVENDTTRVTLRMHIEYIVGLVVARLFDLSIGKSPTVKLRDLTTNQKWLLYWYIVNFAKYLHYRELNQRLGKLLGSKYYLTPENIVKVLLEVLKTVPKAGETMGALSEVLTDWPLRQAAPANIPGQDLLIDLVEICKTAGIDAIYVLVDSLDSANLLGKQGDFEPAFLLIRSLCTTPALHIQYIPGLVFKIFAPEEIHSLAQNVFRPEMGERHIHWQKLLSGEESPLSRVLRKRLQVYSNGLYSSLSPLVEDELAPRIDRLFVEQARTPRELLVLGQGMLEHHFAYPSAEPLLTQKDWEAACRELEKYRQRNQVLPVTAGVEATQADGERGQNLERQLKMARQSLDVYKVQAAGYTTLTIPTDLAVNLKAQQEKVADLEKQLQRYVGKRREGEK